MLTRILGRYDHVLHFDCLVHQGLEGGKIMQVKLTAKSCIESLTECLLLLGINGHLLGSIARKMTKLHTKLINGPSALCEVTELLSFVVHESLRNVVLTKSLTKLCP